MLCMDVVVSDVNGYRIRCELYGYECIDLYGSDVLLDVSVQICMDVSVPDMSASYIPLQLQRKQRKQRTCQI